MQFKAISGDNSVFGATWLPGFANDQHYCLYLRCTYWQDVYCTGTGYA